MNDIFHNHYSLSTGKLKKISYPEGDLKFNHNSTTDNLDSILRNDGEKVTYTYDGSILTKEVLHSPNNHDVTSSFKYDNLMRVSKSIVNGYETTFRYNNDSQITEIKDINYDYDQTSGRLTSSSSVGFDTTYIYNNYGERIDLNF